MLYIILACLIHSTTSKANTQSSNIRDVNPDIEFFLSIFKLSQKRPDNIMDNMTMINIISFSSKRQNFSTCLLFLFDFLL